MTPAKQNFFPGGEIKIVPARFLLPGSQASTTHPRPTNTLKRVGSLTNQLGEKDFGFLLLTHFELSSLMHGQFCCSSLPVLTEL